MAATDFQVTGKVAKAPFTLKLHRGEGMCLLAMNWRDGPQPPADFVGFAIEYCEPGDNRYWPVSNRLAFPGLDGKLNPNTLSSKLSPIQKFRWVHFPLNAEKAGAFTYRVTPVFMNPAGVLSYGVAQHAQIVLARETVAGELNVAFTRGLISSQAFVDRYAKTNAEMATLLPATAAAGLTFVPTHPKAQEAYDWMGFEARRSVIALLDAAVADPTAQVRAVAYDLNEPEIVDRLVSLGPRLMAIVDNSGDHGKAGSAENAAAERLAASAGAANVKRQHMGSLQHNKFIVVGGTVNQAICGSTNFSWRGFFVQANNAVTLTGATAVAAFQDAFTAYFASDAVNAFGATASAKWRNLGLAGVTAKVAFSPHAASNALLQTVADDISQNTTSSLLYSLAFLYQTKGAIRDAIEAITGRNDRFVYGMSEHKVSGLDVQKPDGNVAAVYPSALTKNLPPPFKPEPTGGKGIRLHHKFIVIDFDKPTARVYLGSYNFSKVADLSNGENLLMIADRRVVTAYAVEALGLFDHYHFRVVQAQAKGKAQPLTLKLPPRAPGELPWFADDYAVPYKIRDRELFS
ncbi:phospholipase D-like domain-containing protein [Phenylobacterium sp.]|uniref:phospholipase D-like domain-containing protein n=1 Tax=Phenylobacterium sp. TaxID=1871053 RepID=UPI003569EF47